MEYSTSFGDKVRQALSSAFLFPSGESHESGPCYLLCDHCLLHPTQFLQVQGLCDQPLNPDMSRLEDLYHTQPRQMSLQIQLLSICADGYRFSNYSPESPIPYHALSQSPRNSYCCM